MSVPAASPDATGPDPRRLQPIYRVFVSSTWLDLQPERRALMDALNRMDEMRFVGMEFFGNRPDDTHDASIDQVDRCEVFVGIIGFRYGSGITEAEYRRARALGLPCFVYFKREDLAAPELTDQDPVLAAKLAALRQDLLRDHTVKEFTSPVELAASATADLHNWVAARWISLEREAPARPSPTAAPPDADRTNILRLLERIDQDWIQGVLEASLHHKAWLALGLDWREDAVEHPWDRIVVAPDRPIKTLDTEDSITSVFDAAQHTLLVLGEPGAGKTTTVLELARDLIARVRKSAHEPAPVVLALSTWRGVQRDFADWVIAELGLRYQVPKRTARSWLDDGRLVLLLDGLDEVALDRRAACVEAINAFEQAHHPPGLAVTCRVAEYNALSVKLRLRAAICLQPLTPVQIERYFAAAGAGLDHLRLAMRDDAGLRELARSPLMLSVMAMAWRDAPATTVRDSGVRPVEERRRQLFDAYLQAAMNRRGKAPGGYSEEQTMKWLTWLACRMKEHGHTLFALEQLQPGWLDGAARQFGYYITTRLLGTVLLALPFLLFIPSAAKLLLAGFSAAVGVYIGLVDFGFARHGWGGGRRAELRLWTLVGASLLLFTGGGFLAFSGAPDVGGYSILYLVIASLAFCTPLDVRALDIKPTGSIQFSWRRALRSAMSLLVCLNFAVMLVFALVVVEMPGEMRRVKLAEFFGNGHYFAGLALASVLVGLAWKGIRPPLTIQSVALAITLALLGGQVGGMIGPILSVRAVGMPFYVLLIEFMPVVLIGMVSGYATTMIDPTRPQHAGAWFWLRVPVKFFLYWGFIMTMPGLILIGLIWIESAQKGENAAMVWAALGVGAYSGVVAFFRFGGFNGAQHFFLRWQLARSGNLPPKAESFFSHAAQLALMQKVGLGYRFVHALLLEHLAVTKGGAAARGAALTGETPAPPGAQVAPQFPGLRRARTAGRIVALAGLGCSLVWFFVLVVMGVVSWRSWQLAPVLNAPSIFFGLLCLGLWLAIPVLALGGSGLWRLSWRWIGGAYFGMALALSYLAADDPAIRRPARLADIVPAFPGAEKSYEVLMRYYTKHPAVRDFKRPGFKFMESPEFLKGWRDFVLTHRAGIEANWVTLTPVREWVGELNAFGRIGDLSDAVFAPETIANNVHLAYTKNAQAIASLQALDGQGDAALATLLPMLEVGGKLELSTRRISLFNMARGMQDAAIRAAGFVLDTSAVSAAGRARLAAALVGTGGGSDGARRMFALRHAAAFEAAVSFGQAVAFATGIPTQLPYDLVGPFIFNRRATINRLGDLFSDLQEFAAHRESDKADKRIAEFLAQGGRARFKNMGGGWFSWLVCMRLGLNNNAALQKSYWEIEDRRTALHARLLAP